MERRKFSLIIICVSVFIILFTGGNIEMKTQTELPGEAIEEVCENYGESIKNVSKIDKDKEKYKASIYGVDLKETDYYMQVSISNPQEFEGRMTIGAFRDIGNYNNCIENDFEQYYGLVVDLINLNKMQSITEMQLSTFYQDVSNITQKDYSAIDEGIYYTLIKEDVLNEKCYIKYQIYTFLNEEGDGPEKGATFEEEWIIECYSESVPE